VNKTTRTYLYHPREGGGLAAADRRHMKIHETRRRACRAPAFAGVVCFIILLILLLPINAQAHAVAKNFIQLQVEGNTVHGQWTISLDDLAQTAKLANRDPAFLQSFALEHLPISADGKPCTLTPDVPQERPDLAFIATCPAPVSKLTVDYGPFLKLDPLYATLISVSEGDSTYSGRLSARKPSIIFVAGTIGQWQEFKEYLHEGMWHIWLGYDHILFLTSLLLSAAFILGKDHTWQPRDGFTGTFIQVLKIVTAFTVAHSITLSLVMFDIIALPSRFVESCIALSIAIAAANNLRPVLHKKLWLLTFCFGLIHGMGFASALKELGLPDNARWVALAAFNLGVEIGQVSIVAVVLPFIYAMRRSVTYRRFVFPIISALIIAIALIWFTQRAFNLTLLNGVFGE